MLEQAASRDGQLAPGPLPAGEGSVPFSVHLSKTPTTPPPPPPPSPPSSSYVCLTESVALLPLASSHTYKRSFFYAVWPMQTCLLGR